MALFTSRDFFFHHVAESGAVCKQIWLLCILNLNLNSSWSYGFLHQATFVYIL